jgi:predicted O-methyltransferase YrrM
MTTDLEWCQCWEIAIDAVGHQAQQDVSEFTQALVEVRAIKPKIVLEIGSATGGTLYAWSQVCSEVYAISLPEETYANAEHYGANVLYADSHSAEARAWLDDKLDGKSLDVLFLDGDHTYTGVCADYRNFAPFVRDGGLILFHDVCNPFEPGAVKMWKEIAAEGHEIFNEGSAHDKRGIGIVVKKALAKARAGRPPRSRTIPQKETTDGASRKSVA